MGSGYRMRIINSIMEIGRVTKSMEKGERKIKKMVQFTVEIGRKVKRMGWE